MDAAKREKYKQNVARILARTSVEDRLQGLSEEELLAYLSTKKLAERLSVEERAAGLSPQQGSREELWPNQVGTKTAKVDATKLEGHKEIVARFLASLTLEERLEGLSEDEILAHVSRQKLAKLSTPERVTGLSREDTLLAFPDEDLRSLPESFFDTFPQSVREAVRKRIRR